MLANLAKDRLKADATVSRQRWFFRVEQFPRKEAILAVSVLAAPEKIGIASTSAGSSKAT